ncbi:Zinc finger RanBP2-type [Penicillium longicatenatum]|nr:Zinc finger RanBP2-type [Penicillium longicatenatum]
MRELDPLISEYRHEKKRPREAEALFILRKVASMVKPIMRQRAWRVGALCEFYPSQSNLLGLNVNHGQKICLRLRYGSDQKQFLPIEQITDTMLHELSHIVHGPHNRDFHALWNQLRDEHEELVIKGYTGEGFLSQGKRLGGARIPLDEARRQARATAEKRRILAKNSGKRLGGAPVLRGTDMRKVRADAAQRRLEVMNGCASGTDRETELVEEESRNGFRTKAEEDDANEEAILQAFIELIQEEEREKYGSSYVPPSQENPAGPRTESSLPKSSARDTAKSLLSNKTPAVSSSSTTANNSSYDAPWTCPMCTLENPSNFLCCDVCASERPTPTNTNVAKGSSRQTPAQSVRAEPEKQKKRALPDDTGAKPDPAHGTFAFKNRTRALDTLSSLDRDANKRPLGWVCSCGTFMETQWWTCSLCGSMKPSS